MRPLVRVSCDSIAVSGTLARNGATLFAKNSDRPAAECQPLVQVAAADHVPGAPLLCQYVEIEQVAHTFAFLGSRPHWLWGVEHGVNEHGVAVGNHTIFTKDRVRDVGLLGMDLVRLALERADSARAAARVITELINLHGQGGSGYFDTVWPYHNSFLLADAQDVLLLECSAEYWALREAPGGASASNHVTIGDDWTQLAEGCEQHAIDEGWWDGHGRFDFAAAFRDTTVVPPIVSSGRYAATCSALIEHAGRLDVGAFMRLMRDHGSGGEVYRPGAAPDEERNYTVCMHADPVGTTTASMVVELDADASVRPVWIAFCNPCISPYLPVFVDVPLPAAMTRGGSDDAGGGAWWRFKALLERAGADWSRKGPAIAETWRAFEAETARLVAQAVGQQAGDAALSELTTERWNAALAALDRLEARL